MGKILRWIILCLVILIPVTLPLFTSYIPGTADGLAHKFRLVAFHEAINDGFFRPRWLGNVALGFGAPILMFNYSLQYYLVDLFYRYTGSVNTATQIYQVMTLIFSFGAMFLLGSKLWGNPAGFVSASIYTLAPYHLMSVSLYEGWGEMGAFVFPPLLLYLIIQITHYLNLFQKRKHRLDKVGLIFCYLLYVISYLLFIFTHNISVLMFTPVILLLSYIITGNNRKAFFMICFGFLTAGIISSFFTLPAIFLNHQTSYSLLIEDAIKWRKLFYKSPGLLTVNSFRMLFEKQAKYFDFSLGLPIISVIVIYLFKLVRSLFYSKKRLKRLLHSFLDWKPKNNLAVILILIMFFSIFLISPNSSVLWNTDIFNWIIYPFRFLFLLVFVASLLGGYLSRNNIIFSAIIIFLAIISSRAYTKPYVDIFPFDNSYFLQTQTITTAPETKKNMAVTEFLPKWADKQFLVEKEQEYIATNKSPRKYIFEAGSGVVTYNRVKSEQMQLELDMKRKDTLTINTFYYPNWEASIDGDKTVINKDPYGRMIIEIPEGKHNLKMNFGYDRVEKWGMILSIIGIILFFIEILIIRRLFR